MSLFSRLLLPLSLSHLLFFLILFNLYPSLLSPFSLSQPSIRYNLSLHSCFDKIQKTDPSQKGATWYFVPRPCYLYVGSVLIKRKVDDDGSTEDPSPRAGNNPTEGEHVAVDGQQEVGDDEGDPMAEENPGHTGGMVPARTLGAPQRKERRRRVVPVAGSSTAAVLDALASEDSQQSFLVEAEPEGDEPGGGEGVPRGGPLQHRQSGPHYEGKFSIAKVLAHAISHSPEKRLTLNSLYVWFTENYPAYVTSNEASWKGSIRHNLSYHPMFVKVARSETEPGKGSFWTLDLAAPATPSPSRARRPKYMKTLLEGEKAARTEGDEPGDTSLDTTADLTMQDDDDDDDDGEGEDAAMAEAAGTSSSAPRRSRGQAGGPRKRRRTSSRGQGDMTAVLAAEDAGHGQRSHREGEEDGEEEEEQEGTAGTTRPPIPGLPGFSPSGIDFTQARHANTVTPVQSAAGGEAEGPQQLQPYHTNPAIKPPFSLSILICQAIISSPGNKAYLSDIVSWIMTTYAHYREKRCGCLVLQ